MKNKIKAFTLAETMIVIVILGIIATLTIPALVNKNKESIAKTKVRKAMAAYESALNKMIIENDLKDNGPLNDWAGAVDNCGNPTQYFKKVQGDGCIFKTSDGIWWNISNIERPLIAFKQDDLNQTKANAEDDMSAFVLVGRFDDNGSLRVDDLAYETANSETVNNYKSYDQVKKLYRLLGNIKDNSNGSNELQCSDYDNFCKYLRGDFKDYDVCSETHQACYETDTYSDYHGEDYGIGSYYERTTRRYFYYDESGNYMGEVNIDYGINDGNISFISLNMDDGNFLHREFYRNNVVKTDYDGSIRIGYYEAENSPIGHVEFYNEGVDVIFSKDGNSCEGSMGSYNSCEEIKNIAQEAFENFNNAEHGIKR